MKNLTKFIFNALFVSLFVISCQNDHISNDFAQTDPSTSVEDKNVIFGQYIVFFKESKIPSALSQLGKAPFANREARVRSIERISENSIRKINTILGNNSIDKSKVLDYYTSTASGLAIKLTDKEFDKLSRDKNIASIELDRKVDLDDFDVEKITRNSNLKKPKQEVTCGIDRAGGFAKGHKKRTWIWIIDSGIDLDHPDLNVITDNKYAKSFIKDEPSPNDCNGHGTHVAGTAAAIDNDFGVVGVSAGAPLVPVRVLDCENRSSIALILSGINHVGKYGSPGDVVNMSIGNKTPFGPGCSKNTVFRRALRSLARKGIFVVMAAGNSHQDAKNFEPGCVNGDNIFTVAGMKCHEIFFDGFYSNYNTSYLDPIDFIASGTNVTSTYLNGEYATFSGTSMAAPHVTGIIHARGRAPISRESIYDFRGEGQTYPIALRK